METIIGVGRGARVRRTVSSPGYQPYRTSSPIPRSQVFTPPPLGISPIPHTPEGVYTQVQKKKVVEKDAEDQGSNNTDDLFNDSFDADDIEIAESGLTQVLPNCNIGESSTVSQNQQPSLPEVVKKPDILTKVINNTILGSPSVID